LTPLSSAEIAVLRAEVHPMKAKQDLARRIVADLHGAAAGAAAEANFDHVFRERQNPADMGEKALPAAIDPVPVPHLLVLSGLAPSASEARRLIKAGAVHLDGVRRTDPKEKVAGTSGTSHELQVGKHRFLRVRFE
jgi:tyrosyl-tRNA synthetase